MARLAGKVALITGSSRGIGLAMARAFAAEGARVVVNARSLEAASATAAQLGAESIGIAADVADEASARGLVRAAVERLGRIDILVNNAGMSMVRDSVELSLEDWRRTLDLNLTGAFVCTQEAARLMGAGGVIVNVSSITATMPFPRRLAYGVSKAGLEMMTRILAAEWAPRIRVNAVAPGYVRTDMVMELAASGKLDAAALARRTPMGRLGTPEEIAAAAVFLASDEASFITGETITVDGGWRSYGWV